MFKSNILPEAKNDIKVAALWYNSKQAGLGKKFTNEVRETIRFLQQYPKSFTKKHKNIRTAVLRVFPFVGHYFINEKAKTIIIVAVLHTSRNPDLMMRRK
jgi:plasmid stabilization system protein ParE